MDETRRLFIKQVARGGLLVVSYPIVSSDFLYADVDPTPEQTAGPYYIEGAPVNDQLREPGAEGFPLFVSGQVISTDETPVAKAKVEIWHADYHGQYDLNGFRYRAQLPINEEGKYKFSTVLPGNYGGRPKHIHYIIRAPRHKTLITQLYFENDPFFEGNPERYLNKDPLVQYRELIRPVHQSSVYFRICLERS